MKELRRRWFALLLAGWAVLLVVLAFSAYDGDATVAEQRDIAAARDAVDAATVDLIRATRQGAAVQISDYRYLAACRISLVRGGAEYRRRIQLFTPPGGEAELMDSIASRLSDDYRASSYRSGRRQRLSGSGVGFVELRGEAGRGVVRVDVHTGCRPYERPVATLRTPPTRTELFRLDGVLDLLGMRRDASAGPPTSPSPDQSGGHVRWHVESIECGGGGIRVVELTVPSLPDRPLGDAADLAPPDARILVRETRVLAYRQGAVSVIAQVTGDRLRVTTATATC